MGVYGVRSLFLCLFFRLLDAFQFFLFFFAHAFHILLGDVSKADIEGDVFEVVVVECLHIVLLAQVHTMALFSLVHIKYIIMIS
jgi:hypothetical protein